MAERVVKGREEAAGGAQILNLGEEILLNVLEKLPDRLDRQSWCLVCKEFLHLEATCRKYVHLLRNEILEPILRRYNQVEHLDLSSCVEVTDECLHTVEKLIGKQLLSIKMMRTMGFTCKGLQSIANCSSLQEVDFTNSIEVGDEAVAFLSTLTNLRKLKLSGCKAVTDLGLSALSGCKELRVLDLKYCVGLNDKGICDIAASCKKLHTVVLSFTEVSDLGLSSLAGLNHLENLSLISCNNVSDVGLNYLRQNCKALQRLDVAKCSSVSCVGITALTEKTVQLQQLNLSYCKKVSSLLFSSLQKLKNLQEIKLDGCNIDKADLSLIGNGCMELKELSLSKCLGVADAGVISIVSSCTSLQKLDITCCREITDLTMEAIATCCKGLLALRMESCVLVSAEGLSLIGNGCAVLEELDLTDCSLNDNGKKTFHLRGNSVAYHVLTEVLTNSEISLYSVFLFSEGLKSISRCTKLRILKIGYCIDITDAALVHVGATCKNLREFDSYRSVGIGDEGMAAIAGGCPRLKVVNVSYCANITDVSLQSLAQLKDLVQLELRACVNVTSEGLCYLAASCKHLRELDVKRCSYVSDPGIQAVSQGCPNLRQINLSYTAVTNAGMLAVASMSCIQDMKLVHMKHVTDACFAKTLLACGSLKKVKLLDGLRMTLSSNVIRKITNRGTRLRWMDKPYEA